MELVKEKTTEQCTTNHILVRITICYKLCEMAKFLTYIEDIQETNKRLIALREEYDGKHKGTIYQERRSLLRRRITAFVHKIKELTSDPLIYTYRYNADGEPHCITLIDITKDEAQAYLEIITRQTITNLEYTLLETGVICKL